LGLRERKLERRRKKLPGERRGGKLGRAEQAQGGKTIAEALRGHKLVGRKPKFDKGIRAAKKKIPGRKRKGSIRGRGGIRPAKKNSFNFT